MLKKYKFKLIIFFTIIFLAGLNTIVNAEDMSNGNTGSAEDINTEESTEGITANVELLNDDNTVYIDDVFNAGKDNGYSQKITIDNGDPHYGWRLGKFAITDFSSKRKDSNGNWVLLKNVNDKVSLYFILSQNINNLDGNENLEIAEDKNGYDNEFNIKKSNFGKGMLIVRKIDASGNKNEPTLYRDYLKGITVGANTKIDVFEEGDYEVALDYELRNKGFLFLDSYNNYRIRFNFSVRNGNCMVFPFDIKTKDELTNTSITENGFYLDFANSKYLNVNIKKEVLKEGADGLIEDTRFNRPAKPGEEYNEEAIYTITAKNEYTGEVTIKKIYVGKNKILKAHVQNSDYSISDIKNMVEQGATIDENGNLGNIPLTYRKQKNSLKEKDFSNKNKIINFLPIAIPVIFIILFVVYKIKIKNKEKELTKKKIIQEEREEAEQKNEILENIKDDEKNTD